MVVLTNAQSDQYTQLNTLNTTIMIMLSKLKLLIMPAQRQYVEQQVELRLFQANSSFIAIIGVRAKHKGHKLLKMMLFKII